MAESGVIQSKKDFSKTPGDTYRRWLIEITAAKDNQKPWWSLGEKVRKRYLDEGREENSPRSRLNLFHSNVVTELSILYGSMPQADVSRRFNDADDDAARVGGEMLERILNTDIECDDDGFRSALRYAVEDWQIPGLGQARCRYEAEFEDGEETPAKMDDETGEELAPAVPAVQKKSEEQVETDYVHWRDFLWSPARTWHEVRWVAFRAEMTRDACVERFGDKLGSQVPLVQKRLTDGDDKETPKEAWSRAEVWEIWCKEDKKVRWLAEGMLELLDTKDDPLGLEEFFPCPRPLIANATTAKFMPKPFFELAKNLYDEIDDLTYRIKRLEDMAKVAGAYDASTEELGRILEEAREGQLVPVKNWLAMSEKGGLQAAIAFLPLKEIVEAIEVLTTKRQEKIQLLFQVTGLSDIIRGQASARATATEQQIKAQFGSTRLQAKQDEVARFATDLQRIKSEIISKLYDVETIISQSNIERSETMVQPPPPPQPQMPGMPPAPPAPMGPPQKIPNRPLIEQGVQLIKDQFWQYRIDVKADTIALRDYAALKQDRMEVIQALSALMAQGVPLVQVAGPKALLFVVEAMRWAVAATKGSQQFEATLDKFAAELEQAAAAPPPPPPQDPKLQTEQVKAQAAQFQAKAGMQKTVLDLQVAKQKAGIDQAKAAMDMQQKQQSFGMRMAEMRMQQAIPAMEKVAPAENIGRA